MGGGLLSLSRCSHFWHTKIFKYFVFGLLRSFCHFEPLQKGDPTGCKAQAAAKKSTQIKRKLAIFGYFATLCFAQYDKFGLLSKNNGYFHSNFKAKIHKIHIIHSHFKAKIQILYSKFKAFHKFNSFYKFKAFHNFNSNFKPYTRLFHIFTPSFRSVQTDKKFFTRRTLCLNRIF